MEHFGWACHAYRATLKMKFFLFIIKIKIKQKINEEKKTLKLTNFLNELPIFYHYYYHYFSFLVWIDPSLLLLLFRLVCLFVSFIRKTNQENNFDKIQKNCNKRKKKQKIKTKKKKWPLIRFLSKKKVLRIEFLESFLRKFFVKIKISLPSSCTIFIKCIKIMCW